MRKTPADYRCPERYVRHTTRPQSGQPRRWPAQPACQSFSRHWNAFTALAISVWLLIKAGLVEINDLFRVMFFNNLPELCLFYRVCFPVGERFFYGYSQSFSSCWRWSCPSRQILRQFLPGFFADQTDVAVCQASRAASSRARSTQSKSSRSSALGWS